MAPSIAARVGVAALCACICACQNAATARTAASPGHDGALPKLNIDPKGA